MKNHIKRKSDTKSESLIERFKVVKGNGLETRFIVSLKQSSNETISIKVQSEANASLCGVQVAPMSVDNNSIFHHLLVTSI